MDRPGPFDTGWFHDEGCLDVNIIMNNIEYFYNKTLKVFIE